VLEKTAPNIESSVGKNCSKYQILYCKKPPRMLNIYIKGGGFLIACNAKLVLLLESDIFEQKIE